MKSETACSSIDGGK